MFWDGSRWVDERASSAAPATIGAHRLRDWIATIPILLLVPALLFPFLATLAGGPALSVSGTPTPGQYVTVSGSGFTAGMRVQLQWDGSTKRMPLVTVSSSTKFTTRFRIPSSASLGDHTLTAMGLRRYSGWRLNQASPLASGKTLSDATTSVRAAATATAKPVAPSPTRAGRFTQQIMLVKTKVKVVKAAAPSPSGSVPTTAPTAPPAAVQADPPSDPPTATPTTAPTAPPTAPPTAAPTQAPTTAPAAPPAGSPWSVPFLGRTPSSALVISGQSNVTISGKEFTNLANGTVAIVISNSSNITITGNDFANVTGAIYAVNSTNVTVTWNRFSNIGNGTIGSGHSNYVQFNNTWGGYIGHNKGIGGNSEDLISVYKSGGSDAAHPLVIEYNNFEGTNWTSGSGSGMMIGDAGGSHVVARYNTLLTSGQVGIGIPGGTDIHITDNVLYGAKRTSANVGIYVWNQSGGTCSGNEVTRNQVKWYNASGSENPYWNGGGCGTVAGESGNTWHATIDPTTLHVTL